MENKKESVISELGEEQQFYITLLSKLSNELVDEKIITPTQSGQIKKYMISKMNSKD